MRSENFALHAVQWSCSQRSLRAVGSFY